MVKLLEVFLTPALRHICLLHALDYLRLIWTIIENHPNLTGIRRRKIHENEQTIEVIELGSNFAGTLCGECLKLASELGHVPRNQVLFYDLLRGRLFKEEPSIP